MKFTTIIFAVLTTVLTAVSGAPLPEFETNAARFANGLPPLPQRAVTPVQGM